MTLPTFHDKELFERAFTHRSFLNETKSKKPSNERLEFLGDSILSYVVSVHFYKTYPQFHEGTLTNLRSQLVNTKSLAVAAKTLGFGEYLKLSKGEEESHGRENQSLLADSFEAFIGALYIDQGLEAAKDFIHQALLPKAEEIVRKKDFKDPKSMLQEHAQATAHAAPVYSVLLEEGPSHAKQFTVGVSIKEQMLGQGVGKSKQEAEEQAAKQALEKMKK